MPPTYEMPTETGISSPNRLRVAILIVNGFDKRGHWGQYTQTESLDYPWIDICLRQIERHSREWDYEVLVFDNSHLQPHHCIMRKYQRVRKYQKVSILPREWVASLGRLADGVDRHLSGGIPRGGIGRLLERHHPEALDYLVGRVASDTDYIVTLDTDSFPVRDDWLDVLVAECESGAALAGVYRDEMTPKISPFVHVSGLCVRPSDLRSLDVSFARRMGQDVGQNITDAFVRTDRKIAPLKRSNQVNFHFLIGGIYGDVIYHHGAGSRKAKFWTSVDLDADEEVRVELRNAAFRDIDHLVAILRGQAPNDLGLKSI